MSLTNYIKRWVLEPSRILAQRFREELDDLNGGDPPGPIHPLPSADLVIHTKMPADEPDYR